MQPLFGSYPSRLQLQFIAYLPGLTPDHFGVCNYPNVRLVYQYDGCEQGRQPHGTQERPGPQEEMGQEGVRASHAAMGQAWRASEGDRHEEETRPTMSIYKRGEV